MALIGSIAINMTTDTRAFIAGLVKASAALKSFGKIGNTLFKANPFFTFLAGGVTAAKGIAQLKGFSTAIKEAATDFNVLRKAGLLDAGQAFRIFGNLVGDTAPALIRLSSGLAAIGIGSARLGLGGVAIGLNLATGALRLFGRALIGTIALTRQAVIRLGEFAAVTGLIGGFALAKIISGASHLNEVMSQTQVVFGESSSKVVDSANLMADAFGLSKREFLGAATALGSIFKTSGYSADQAATLSTEVVKLANDLSSIKDISFDQALTKIRAGLVGEAEPLRTVGVLLSETAVKQEALRLGIVRGNAELTEGQKVQSRLSLIVNQTKDAVGDFARTQDGVANSTRSLMGRIENLADTLGTILLPIASSVLGELQMAVTVVDMAFRDWGSNAVQTGVSVVGANAEATKSLGFVQQAIGFVADAWQTLSLGFQAAQSYITYGLGKIVTGLSYLGGAIDSLVEKLTGMKLGLGDFLKTYGEDLNNLSNRQWADFQKELAKPPRSDGINDYFTKAQERIKGLQKEAVKSGVDVTKITPANAAKKPMAAGPTRFASAAALGSREASNAILTGIFGGTRTKGPQDQTAKNTGETAKGIKELVTIWKANELRRAERMAATPAAGIPF